MRTKVKTTNAEHDRRITKIFELLMLGLSRASIIQYVSDKTKWNVTERQIDNYIQEATEQLKEISRFKRDEELGRAVSRIHTLFQSCMRVQDYKGALAAQKELNALLGLYEPRKLEHSGAVEIAIKGYKNVSPDDFDQSD